MTKVSELRKRPGLNLENVKNNVTEYQTVAQIVLQYFYLNQKTVAYFCTVRQLLPFSKPLSSL
jgi:hypothetical protein